MSRIPSIDAIGKTVDAIAFSRNDDALVIGFSDGTFMVATPNQPDFYDEQATIHEPDMLGPETIRDYLDADFAFRGGFISKAIFDAWRQDELKQEEARRAARLAKLKAQVAALEQGP